MVTQTEVLQKMSDAGDRMLSLVEKFDTEADNIDAAVAAAVAAAPAMNRTFYIDSVVGNDEVASGTAASPFFSVAKAVNSIPVQGGGTIIASLNQTFVIDENIHIAGKNIHFTTNGSPTNDAERPVLQFLTYASGGYDEIKGFTGASDSTLKIGQYRLELDDNAFSNGLPSTGYCFIRSANGNAVNANLVACDVDLGDNAASLLNCEASNAVISMQSVDFESTTTPNIINTGTYGTAIVSVTSCVKDASTNWYNDATRVLSNV